MVEHQGWQVAATFGNPSEEAARTRESVGLADLSWMSKFNLQGSGMKNAPDLGPDVRVWLLGRREYLVTCEPLVADAAKARLVQIMGVETRLRPPIYVTDVTSVYTQLMVAGPNSREVLSKLTSLNLSEGARGNLSCAQANVAHVHAVVLRNDLPGIPAFHLLVGREYGESLWESVLHAGHESHITPLGLEAQKLLQK